MKISKSGLLNLSLVFTVLGLGLVAVSMAQRQLYVDLNNAAQYMEKVKFISTGSNDSAFLEQIGDGSVKIQTNNFILSRTGSDENIISGAYYSSILGGIKNKIEGKGGRNSKKGTNVIIGGSENLIKSEYNVILGGKGNQIENGKYSVILGGKDNNLSGDYSVILGSDNKLEGSQSTVVGKSGYVKGNYSAALGTNSKVEANNSFLWTDGSTTETLTGDNLFVIMAGSGMIINNNVAHRFAKLTIGGPLIVSSKNTDENIQCGTGKGGGILKIKNAGSQMCLCSCNGSGRNSMLGKGKCMGICDSSIKPECGNDVQRIKVGNFIEYSGSCIFGRVVKGTGAYLVTKDDKVHWSCQTDDGQTIGCSGVATGLPYVACHGSHAGGDGVILGSSSFIDGFGGGSETWTYTESTTPGTCEWTCDSANGYHRDGESCVNTYPCGGDVPGLNTRQGPNTTTNPNQEWTYVVDPTAELGACEWSCINEFFGRGTGDNKMNCRQKFDGECGNPAEHFKCEEGEPIDMNTGDTAWTWKCGGGYGGDADSCKECRTDLGYYKNEAGECVKESVECCPSKPSHSHEVSVGGDGCYDDPEDIIGDGGHCVDKAGADEYCDVGFDAPCASLESRGACSHRRSCCVREKGDGTIFTPDSIVPIKKFFKCDESLGYVLSSDGCSCVKAPSLSCNTVCGTGANGIVEYAGECYQTCFTSGTKVTMADGSQKNIEDIKIGEKVLGSNGTINTVLGYDRPILGGRHLWSINGSEYFVSDEHPFKTTEGWKSFNPEMTKREIDLNTTELKVGDVLITENGQEEIKSVDYIDADYNTPLYNLILDGNHTYHANSYLVHNKSVEPLSLGSDGCRSAGYPRVGSPDSGDEGCCPKGYTHIIGGRCKIYCGPLRPAY